MKVPFNLLALVVGSVALLTMGALAWRRNYHSRAVRSFFIACNAFVFWLVTNYFSIQHYSFSVADLLTRLTYLSGLWLIIATWYFCFSFPIERRPGIWTRVTLVIALIGGGLFSMSRLVVEHIGYQGQQLIIIAGSIYWLYGVILAVLVIMAMINLRRNYAAANLLQRNQIRYVAFGVIMGTTLSIIFDVFLVLENPRWGSSLVNLSITLLTVIFLSYGFIRHRYTDVHRLVAWLLTYIVCLGLLAGLLLGANAALARLYPNSTTIRDSSLLIIASLLIFILQPISRWLKRRADHIFNVGWYDSQNLLNNLGTMLAGELHLAPLLKNSLSTICTELRVVSGELVIVNEGQGHQSAHFGHWPNQYRAMSLPALPNINDIIIVDELAVDDPVSQVLTSQAIRISVPLQTRGHRVGYLFLGVKRSGDIFSAQDIAVLNILSSQLAVAIVSVQAYEQISQFNATLQKEIAEATADLREAHKKLQLDDQMKTEFIVLTSHNLRTPLSIIKGYISLLEESQLSAAQHKLLESMKAGTDRLGRLTEDLLAIDSIVAGDQFVLQPVSAEAIIIPLVKEAADLAKAKGLKFSADLLLKDVVVEADANRLSSAIRNLLNNACKFTERGSVTLSAARKGANLIITVTDTGIGIAATELPNLFSKFHRATSTMEYNYEGVGIGLYLTNLVVKEHGGHISVQSQLHKGTSFTISLPLGAKTRKAKS